MTVVDDIVRVGSRDYSSRALEALGQGKSLVLALARLEINLREGVTSLRGTRTAEAVQDVVSCFYRAEGHHDQ